MTRKEFELIENNEGFDTAMGKLREENNMVTDYQVLKEYIIKCLDDDNNGLALFLLDAIYNSKGQSDFYYYDYTAGTTCTPRCLNDINDVEEYIGFDKE